MSKSKRKILPDGKVLDWHLMTHEERIAFLKKIHTSVNSEVKKEVLPYVPQPPCHTGNVLAFKDPVTGVEMYGGGSIKNCLFYDEMIVIDLADNYPPELVISGLIMPELEKAAQDKRIKLSWKDYGVPRLGKGDWEILVKELRAEVKRLEVKKILVCCVGGHGRTGTALAILAGLMGAVKDDPVKFIRENYCKKAVESNAQLKYVEEVTGIEVREKIHEVKTVSGKMVNGVWVSEPNPYRDLPLSYDGI